MIQSVFARQLTERWVARTLTQDLPDLGYRWPDPYFDVPQAERSRRIVSTPDTCSIDERDFFIRGVLLIPIRDQANYLGIGVWVSQKRENYQTYLDNFDTDQIGPFFGWLSNRIQGDNKRPLIRVEPTDHPLAKDYSEGITLDRAWSIVHFEEPASGT